MCSQTTVFQELYRGKTEISRQVSKCSLVSVEGLEVMTVNVEEGKYRGGEKMCLWRYRVVWHSCTGLRGLLEAQGKVIYQYSE